MSALALLQAAISLLLAIQALGPLATEDLKQQANQLATAAITVANYELAHSDMTENENENGGGTGNQPGGTTPPPSGGTAPEQEAPKGPATIEIVAVNGSQELGDTFAVQAEGTDQSLENTVFLGAIVRDADGNVLKDESVEIEAGDESKTLNGTGNFWGAPHNVHYYPFSFTFTEAGQHEITFTAGDVSESVTLTAE